MYVHFSSLRPVYTPCLGVYLHSSSWSARAYETLFVLECISTPCLGVYVHACFVFKSMHTPCLAVYVHSSSSVVGTNVVLACTYTLRPAVYVRVSCGCACVSTCGVRIDIHTYVLWVRPWAFFSCIWGVRQEAERSCFALQTFPS